METELDKISKVNGKVSVGELIVSKGEVVKQKTYLKLISYKKEFEGKQLSARANKFIVTGQILLLSLCFLIIFLFIMKNKKSVFKDTNAIKFISDYIN